VLLTAFAIFAGVQLGASVLCDYRWPQLRFPHYYEVMARFDAVETPPNVLFLGSSRTMCAVDEERVTAVVRARTGNDLVQCFNAGVPSADCVVQERVLRDLLARGVRPRYVLIELCPECVNQRIGWLSLYTVQFLRWDDTPLYFTDLVVTNNILRFASSRFVPLYVYRKQIRQRLAARAARWRVGRLTAKSVLQLGDATPWHIGQYQEGLAAKLIAEHIEPSKATSADVRMAQRSVYRYHPGGNAAAALERLLDCCREHGIEPVLLGVPLSSAHRSVYTPAIESAFQEYLAQIERKYGCRYLDYRTALEDAQFLDHHHARAEGGAWFSERIATEVLAPLLQHNAYNSDDRRYTRPR
jgi:hypothetical protein